MSRISTAREEGEMKLEGKIAIVTAAGRGIGKAIALCLAEEGADVVANSFHEETTAKVADEIKALGRRALGIPGDITKADMVLQVVGDTINEFGKVDIVVNSIGSGPMTARQPGSGPLGRIEAIWDAMYEQNLKATVLMCEAVAPHLREQKSGEIINISSIAARAIVSEKLSTYGVAPPAYSSMKAGLINYTQFLAERLGPYNINVNCVCPGIIYTDAWQNSSKRVVENLPEFKGQDPREWFVGIGHGKYPDMLLPTPMRREQTVEDIGRAIVFLVSDDSRNITGQALNVDGGMIKS